VSSAQKKITVLLDPDEFHRFDRFCREQGFKKSTLLVRLLREFLERDGAESDKALPLFENQARRHKGHRTSS
jgi:hypothetical protein